MRARVFTAERVAVRLKPGSLTQWGEVVDHDGRIHPLGPCFVDLSAISEFRAIALAAAGWKPTRAGDRPGNGHAIGLTCIHRVRP